MRRNGGRGFIDWAATSPDGDAASGASDIEAWLAAQPTPRPDADWEPVLGRIRDGMQQLMSSRLIRQDATCREILGRLDRASSLADLDAAMEALGHRVSALLRPAEIIPPTRLRVADPAPPPESRKAGSLRSFLRL